MIAFMHNGVISDFTPIRRALSAKLSDSSFANVFGSTDSEHLAALYAMPEAFGILSVC
jgi:glutamine amidotransferase